MGTECTAATMRANQLRLYFSSVAYLLLHALRRPGAAPAVAVRTVFRPRAAWRPPARPLRAPHGAPRVIHTPPTRDSTACSPCFSLLVRFTG